MARRYSLLVLAIMVFTIIDQSVAKPQGEGAASEAAPDNCEQSSEGYCIQAKGTCDEGFEPVPGAICPNARSPLCCRRELLSPPPPPATECPEGYFLMQKSMQCFQLFVGDSKVSWSKAKQDCEAVSAFIAQPRDEVAVDLRKYLYTEFPGTFPLTVDGWYAGVWMGAHRVYQFQWLNKTPLLKTDPLWMQLEKKYPGTPVSSCAMMLVSENLANLVSPDSVYGTDECEEKQYYTLCEKDPTK